MMGSAEQPGLIPRLCSTLFSRTVQEAQEGESFAVEVSYMEIYNEKVRDLLDPKGWGTSWLWKKGDITSLLARPCLQTDPGLTGSCDRSWSRYKHLDVRMKFYIINVHHKASVDFCMIVLWGREDHIWCQVRFYFYSTDLQQNISHMQSWIRPGVPNMSMLVDHMAPPHHFIISKASQKV